MRLSATITVQEEPELVMRVFAAEDKAFKHGRSSYSIEQQGGKVVITAEASDPTALRATVTSITRILNIIEKTK